MDIRRHFEQYSRSFLSGAEEADKSLFLKIDHTLSVWREAVELAKSENFDEKESRLLSIAALLHDYARFEQYQNFRTFRDSDSFDHGDRAAELVEEHGLLKEDFTCTEQKIILDAIRWHNKLAIPENMEGTARKIAQAVRDSDKLDIMPRLLKHLSADDNSDVTWGMPYSDKLSPAVEAQLLTGVPPDYSLFRNTADFIASKTNWVYDLNFRHSRRKILQSGFLEALRKFLPENHAIDKIWLNAGNYLWEESR